MPRLTWTAKRLHSGGVQHIGRLGQVACAYVTPLSFTSPGPDQPHDVEVTLPGARHPRAQLTVDQAKEEAEQRVTQFLMLTGLLDQLDDLRDQLKDLRVEMGR